VNSRATASITPVRVILTIIGEILRRNNLHGTGSFMTENHNTLVGSNRPLAGTGNAVIKTELHSLLMKRIFTEDAVHIEFTDTVCMPSAGTSTGKSKIFFLTERNFFRNLKQKFGKTNVDFPAWVPYTVSVVGDL